MTTHSILAGYQINYNNDLILLNDSETSASTLSRWFDKYCVITNLKGITHICSVIEQHNKCPNNEIYSTIISVFYVNILITTIFILSIDLFTNRIRNIVRMLLLIPSATIDILMILLIIIILFVQSPTLVIPILMIIVILYLYNLKLLLLVIGSKVESDA